MKKEIQAGLRETLLSVFPLSEASCRLIENECEIHSIKKLQLLTSVGSRNSAEYFLLNGILHRYNYNEAGEPVTTGFYFSPTIITPHFARTAGGRSLFFIQVLTAATVASLPVVIMDKLRISFTDIQQWGHKVIQSELAVSLEREISFRSQSARERLIQLRQHFPNIENLVPHTNIASYLGITPVSFSRLRHELATS
jgi:CRP-like cAMP-binding protein